MEASDPAEQPPHKAKRLFWTVVTVLVWFFLVIGVASIVAGVVRLIQGNDLALASLLWGLFLTTAAGWTLWRERN